MGSDGLMPDVWPVGSWFVLMNGVPEQIDLSANLRQVEQHFRIGPAARGYDDPSYVHLQHAFDGNGLRPYAPAHLAVEPIGVGDQHLSWIRRTRIEGDNWTSEVPVGEDTESYRVQVHKDGALLREVLTSVPEWTYPSALAAVDGAIGAVEFSVAQVSARYGPGLETWIAANL